MSRKKGKARQRRSDWQQHYASQEEDHSAAKQKFAPKAAKLPSWRAGAEHLNLDQLPKCEGMVAGLFPGGALVLAGRQQMLCSVAGTFRPPEGASALAVGDIVTVAMTATEVGDQTAGDKLRVDGMIIARQMRKTLLARPQPRSGKRRDQYGDEPFLKVIAANMDQLLIVASTRQPKLRPALLERFIIIAERGELVALLAINKIDLALPDERTMDELSAIHVEPIFISAATGHGMDLLRTRLAGKRTVLAGASGTGKSTIVNALVPGALAVTRPIRMKDQRGRHTTAAAAVYDLSGSPGDTILNSVGSSRDAAQDSSRIEYGVPAPYSGGLLVDTPGVRELGMEMEPGELSWYFPEFEPFARNCHFNDCSHTHEPQCAVIAAVEQGAIPARRYESYLRLAETIQEH